MSAVIREVILPQLTMGMAEAAIVEWLVTEGAAVSRDQPMVSIETEKVVTELPAPSAGIVHLVARVGDRVPIETVIAMIAPSEEAYRALLESGGNRAAIAGNARGAGGRNLDTRMPADGIHGGAAVATRPLGASATPQRIIASGAAKAFARDHGIDLATLAGTGPGGRIVESDVVRELANAGAAALGDTSATRRARVRIPFAGTRRAIAERMVKATTQAAQTFVFFEIDVTDLLRVRGELLEKIAGPGGKLSLLAFYARAVALACKRVPIANATLEGDEICLWDEVNIGIAVSLPGSAEFDSSLMVPVVHGADRLDIAALNGRIQQQVTKARDGTLTPADVAQGTITIASTGGFTAGAWAVSTPLLNLPQVINFQPGTPLKRPLVIGDEIAIRSVLPCGLTFDHRCLDGEPAGRFVRELSGYLNHPETMLA